jgi:hypothetical protein
MISMPVNIASFGASAITQAIRALYGVAGDLNEFLDGHIGQLKASADPAVSAVGRVLEGAKQGLIVGYVAPVVIIAVGQLLLGNPLAVLGTAVSAVLFANPIAQTCAAVGAIVYGWRALNDAERAAILQKLQDGMHLAAEVVQQVIEFTLGLVKKSFGSKQLAALKETLASHAAWLGRSMYAITGKVADLVYGQDAQARRDSDVLASVLRQCHQETELVPLLVNTLKYKKNIDALKRAELEELVAKELLSVAAYSVPGARLPTYDDTVRMVSKQLKLPHRSELAVDELERVILFKVIEKSLDRLDEGQKVKLSAEVNAALEQRGIDKKVTYSEVLRFVKSAGLDLGGLVGGLAFAAPGVAGIVGLNFLQFAVLKGLLLTSGYFAAGGALLGLGVGGALMTIAGAAGPIGIGAAVLYAGYSLSGPAYRKLVPAICVIAAKRIEISARPEALLSTSGVVAELA